MVKFKGKFLCVLAFIVFSLFILGCNSNKKEVQSNLTESINLNSGAVLKSENGDYNLYDYNERYTKLETDRLVLAYDKSSNNYVYRENNETFATYNKKSIKIEDSKYIKLKLSPGGNYISYFVEDNGMKLKVINIKENKLVETNSNVSISGILYDWYDNKSLVRNRDNKVMESIKHITPDINSYRVLYPGVNYVFPPKSEKLNPFTCNYDEFNTYISCNNLVFDDKFYSMCFTGISKLLSQDLYSTLIKKLPSPTRSEIYNNFKDLINNLDKNLSFKMYTTKTGLIKDFYSLNLCFFEQDYNSISYDNPNKLMDDFYSKKDKQDRLQNKSTDLQKLIHTNIERCNKKSKILHETLKECNEKEDFKIKGDLLTSFIYTIKKGDKECSLLNFYNENNEEYITISLDSNKTPSENVQRYYRKYNKLKISEEYAKTQLSKNEEEIKYLNSVLTNIINVESYDEIDEIKKELIETGYIRFNKNSKNNKKNKNSKPHHFISSNNIDIYVGKNNLQNDYLSLKFANKNYLWLHAKDIPGSHVIVCGFDIPDKTLEEAAIIAGYYSKGKNSTKLSIDYTKVKELKKPNGAKPGMVIYHTNRTIVINPSEFTKIFQKNN